MAAFNRPLIGNSVSNPRRFCRFSRGQQKKQRGAAGIEFGLVFILLFAVFYGAVSYFLPLLLMQSFNHASTEAVREVLIYDPRMADYQTTITTEARRVVGDRLNWVPSNLGFDPQQHVSVNYANGEIRVTISYPSSLLFNVVPKLVLPGIGSVPSVPDQLAVESSFRLSRS